MISCTLNLDICKSLVYTAPTGEKKERKRKGKIEQWYLLKRMFCGEHIKLYLKKPYKSWMKERVTVIILFSGLHREEVG
jgi:hypothetical protein